MNILIVNGHCIVREGLKHLIHSFCQDATLAEAEDGVHALKLIAEEKNAFDLIVTDLRLPGIDGLALLQRLHQDALTTPVMVFSSSEDPEDIDQAFHFGVRAFISKSANPEKIRDAIITPLAGDTYYPDYSERDDLHPCWAEQHHITGRQLQILRLTKKGRPNGQIAEQLFITERTVKAHVSALFESFGVRNRTELIYRAHQLGLD